MPRHQLFTLNEATFYLYPAAADGSALTTLPLWIGACEAGVELPHGFDPIALQPTASLYPVAYHRRRLLRLRLRRLWVLPYGSSLVDFRPGLNDRYVLEAVWQDGERAWHKRTYFGVTAEEWNLASNGIMEFEGEQILQAQSLVDQSGLGTYTPAATPVPMSVRWVDGLERLKLYDYAAGTFTEVGPTAGRGTIALSASIVLAQVSAEESFRVAENKFTCIELVEVGALVTPRLEFVRGDQVLGWASVGQFQCPKFFEGTPTAAADRFCFYNDGTLVADLGPLGLTALAFEETVTSVILVGEDGVPYIYEDTLPIEF